MTHGDSGSVVVNGVVVDDDDDDDANLRYD